MYTPFHYLAWDPTRPPNRILDNLTPKDVTEFSQDLAEITNALHIHSHDPSHWLRRAELFSQLHYPELATGSAHKSALLCNAILDNLDRHPQRQLGHKMGFYLLDDGTSDYRALIEAQELLRHSITMLRRRAEDLIENELEYAPDFPDGLFIRRPYPWLEEFANRGDDVLDQTNNALGSYCEVRRNAFGTTGSQGGSEVWGVFAKEDIKAETVVVVDHTRTWGCNGPGINGSRENLNGGLGCMDELHPNADDDNTVHDLRWIRDRCGVHAADVVLHCRALLCTIVDKASHPLRHPSLARLTPAYRAKPSAFQLNQDIVVPNEALRRFGIDIFANFNYDTDVIFTILARIDNNSWTDPSVSGLNDLFAMFNHSCEPNCGWVTQPDHAKMQVQTEKDVMKGEQLFVHYDTYVQDETVVKRRKRLRRWLAGDCQCTRCVREEKLLGDARKIEPDMSWDSDVKSRLLEDEVLENFKTKSDG